MTKRINTIVLFYLLSFVLLTGSAVVVSADHEEHEEKDRHHECGKENQNTNHKKTDNSDFKPPTNQTYKTTCGECHLVYPPELMPGTSWEKILDQPEDHFGEALSLDPSSKEEIRDYLLKNGADRSSSKKAAKIMKGLKGQSPLRVRDVPYIKGKHHEIASEVFDREAIGSMSNCAACHKTAEQGDFDDDHVVIPQ